MGFFKKKVIKEIPGAAWGHLVSVHNIDVDTLSNNIRCVEQEGLMDGNKKVHFLRVFKVSEAVEKGVAITGWETFDTNPDLILFEGYWDEARNEAYLKPSK
jgi:hypothetical protein